MTDLLLKHPKDFAQGYNPITTINEKEHNTDINFGILKLAAGEEIDLHSELESAYLLMTGEATLSFDDTEYQANRQSIFDEDPIAIHLAANQNGKIVARSDCEFALSQVENDQTFATMVFDSGNILESEHRGQGLLNDTAYRIVRTIFDVRNRPDAKLVLGEVITFPGRWSSYPPHHHPQPEIYHYRFTEPQGFGFGQTGNDNGEGDVVTIKHNSTLKVMYDLVHSQVAAPGYGMYYIWVIRHLDNCQYTVPTFDEAHAWTMTEQANERAWQG